MARPYRLVDGTGTPEHKEALDDYEFPAGAPFPLIEAVPGGPYDGNNYEATRAAVRDAWSGDGEAMEMLEKARGNPDVDFLAFNEQDGDPYILCRVLNGGDDYYELQRNDSVEVFDSDEDAVYAAVMAARAGFQKAVEIVNNAKTDPKVLQLLGSLGLKDEIEGVFGGDGSQMPGAASRLRGLSL